MRSFINICRVLVGILFIASGLVKANDPLGLSYKMQEFFEVWNSDLAASGFFAKAGLMALFNWLHGYSLLLSMVMITLEIVTGVALLLGWRRHAVLRTLMVLIVFFTFLTAYAFWSGKFKNCGCFGDCLPITPLTSFLKDVVLLVLIVALWMGRRYIVPITTRLAGGYAVAASLVATVLLQWYVLNYLPFTDCLPYKVGNNISQQMQIPAGALSDSFAIRFVYKKNGKQFEFPAEALPADLASYTYVDRVDKLVRKGNAEPPIKGFALTGLSGTDSTQAILGLPQTYLLLAENLGNKNLGWMIAFKQLTERAGKKGIPVFLVTAGSLPTAVGILNAHKLSTVPVFACDFTAIRTAARTNPTLVYLQKGTIKGKYSFRQMADVAEHL